MIWDHYLENEIARAAASYNPRSPHNPTGGSATGSALPRLVLLRLVLPIYVSAVAGRNWDAYCHVEEPGTEQRSRDPDKGSGIERS